ncbi:Rz-like lysis system protein LysB [Glaciimonas immobilis]|uniref:LysB family phage lysis regulatory protein n=1 Tax=Glaciimonas immobilis TaxID=728004 RepID=A0A840RKE6_9BURK|nr:Rz-like lysis system protein LysB [Glaciimonas immobilis]KAF3999228.1 LysB family phage lysis regulatory protein [Glaciimonas immobilis]MBB5198687.1 LysB family phage lysis regulatory protein [Glaciimonas immobilis]
MISKWISILLIVGGLATMLYVQRGSLSAAKGRADRAEKNVSERDAIIDTLNAINARHRAATVKLQADHAGIAATLSARETLIKKLQHENATIRHWAESPLPDAIARLRQRPAVTGATAYRQRLSAGHPLPAPSQRADD